MVSRSAQQSAEAGEGKAYHIIITSFNALNKTGPEPLDAVGSRLVEGFAAVDIGVDVGASH